MRRKKLTPYLATAIAEGFGEGEDASAEDQLRAWQYLIDKGICWKLQGYFGRTAMQLIEEGLCKAAKTTQYDYYGNRLPSRKELEAEARQGR